MTDRNVTERNYSAGRALGIHHAVGAVVFLRMMSSLAWLDSAFIGKDAKLAPTFLSGAGLAEVITKKFVHTALTPAITDILQNIVLPNAAIFALLIAFGDLAIGISLSLGLLTRLGGMLAIMRAITNILAAGGAGPDTIGFNALLIVSGIICIVTRAGRNCGIDRFLLARWPSLAFLRLIA
jgi:TQO small subunit DoxD